MRCAHLILGAPVGSNGGEGLTEAAHLGLARRMHTVGSMRRQHQRIHPRPIAILIPMMAEARSVHAKRCGESEEPRQVLVQ